MIFGIYCMRDIKAGFMSPSIDVNNDVAIRNFKNTLSNAPKDSIIGFSPSDFELYKIGSFNSDSGSISPLDIPDMISYGGVSDEI